MSTIFLIAFVSYVTVLASGFPMFIAPPERIIEKPNLQTFDINFGHDMIYTPGSNRKSQFRGAAVLKQHKWPNSEIPYDISAITNTNHRDMITHAMQVLMYDTGSPVAGSKSRSACVFFRPRTSSDVTYLTIQYGSGCNAHVGYWPKSRLTLTLDKDCYDSGTIQHELMHVLGFHHEQNRPDRDNYVSIHFDNIIDEFKFAFEKQAKDQSTDLNTPYDYNSIMHYRADSYSKNGKPTIVPKQQNIKIKGNLAALSPIDIEEVRRYYGCAP